MIGGLLLVAMVAFTLVAFAFALVALDALRFASWGWTFAIFPTDFNVAWTYKGCQISAKHLVGRQILLQRGHFSLIQNSVET